jgi:hypothetical protein
MHAAAVNAYAYASMMFLCLRGFALSYHQYFMPHGYDALLQYDYHHSYAAMPQQQQYSMHSIL